MPYYDDEPAYFSDEAIAQRAAQAEAQESAPVYIPQPEDHPVAASSYGQQLARFERRQDQQYQPASAHPPLPEDEPAYVSKGAGAQRAAAQAAKEKEAREFKSHVIPQDEDCPAFASVEGQKLARSGTLVGANTARMQFNSPSQAADGGPRPH